MNNQQLWQAILGSLEISLSKANFNTWFKNTSISERGNDFIIVAVPSAFNRDWIAAKYQQEILKALKTLAPEIKEITYQLGAATSNNETKAKTGGKSFPETGMNKNEAQQNGSFSRLNPKYTFDTLII